MIVTCGSCLTKFRLDDSKISTRGRKVRCSRCKHTFLVTPPPVTKREILENFESFDRCQQTLIDPDQKKVDVPPPLKTERIEKAAENEEPPSIYQETIPEKVKPMVPSKALREEKIKVKTFKIDKNSFCIEWNINW